VKSWSAWLVLSVSKVGRTIEKDQGGVGRVQRSYRHQGGIEGRRRPNQARNVLVLEDRRRLSRASYIEFGDRKPYRHTLELVAEALASTFPPSGRGGSLHRKEVLVWTLFEAGSEDPITVVMSSRYCASESQIIERCRKLLLAGVEEVREGCIAFLMLRMIARSRLGLGCSWCLILRG
jgi:hypothetical protein